MDDVDRGLLHRVAAGDQRAFEDLYARHGQPLLAYAGDPGVADADLARVRRRRREQVGGVERRRAGILSENGGSGVVEPPGFEGVFDDPRAGLGGSSTIFKKRWLSEDQTRPAGRATKGVPLRGGR